MRALLLGCLLLLAPEAHAGLPFTQCLSGEEGEVVLAVEVLDPGNPHATNDAPPLVTLRVLDVLSGRAPAARLRVTWLPGGHDIDTVGGDSAARLAAWEETAFPGPRVGARLLVRLGIPNRPGPSTRHLVQSVCVTDDTPADRAELRAGLRQARAEAREMRAREAREQRERMRTFLRVEAQRRNDARDELPRLSREATDVWLVRKADPTPEDFSFDVLTSLKGDALRVLQARHGGRYRLTLTSDDFAPHLWTLFAPRSRGGAGVRELVLYLRPHAGEVPPECRWRTVDRLLATLPADTPTLRAVRMQLARGSR